MRGPNKVKKTPQEKAAARAERLAKQQKKQREAAGVYDNTGNNGGMGVGMGMGMGMGGGMGQDLNAMTGFDMNVNGRKGGSVEGGGDTPGYGRDVRSVQNDYSRGFGGVPDSAGGRSSNHDGSGYNNPPYSAGSASSFHQSQSGYNPYPPPSSKDTNDYYSSFSRGGASGGHQSGPGSGGAGGQENFGGDSADDRARGQTSNARYDADGGMASPGRQEGSQQELNALFMAPGGSALDGSGLHAGGGDGEQWD